MIEELEEILEILERTPRLKSFYTNGGIIRQVAPLPEPFNTMDEEIQEAHDRLERVISNLKDS